MSAHILLLAGTAEARSVAERLSGMPGLDLTASLAGVTSTPAPIAARTRQGGFGGAGGLAEYLATNSITAVIDATHPFASQMATNAAMACAATGTPRLRLMRPPWKPCGDWHGFTDIASAAAALPAGAHALVTTGRKETAAFAARSDIRCLLRTIEPVRDLPGHITQRTARPPFTFESELELMRGNGITHLVSKNSGGPGRAKLDAATRLAVPILMVERPAPPPGPIAETVETAVAWTMKTAGAGD